MNNKAVGMATRSAYASQQFFNERTVQITRIIITIKVVVEFARSVDCSIEDTVSATGTRPTSRRWLQRNCNICVDVVIGDQQLHDNKLRTERQLACNCCLTSSHRTTTLTHHQFLPTQCAKSRVRRRDPYEGLLSATVPAPSFRH
jgi:hypothetical protein